MPTYSYACPECGHAFDIRQSFTEDALTVCPECSATTLRKVIHPVGIAFKGSGFYKTDSRASAKGSKGPAGSSSGSGDAASTSSASDTGSAPSTTSSSGASTPSSTPSSGSSSSSSSSPSSTSS